MCNAKFFLVNVEQQQLATTINTTNYPELMDQQQQLASPTPVATPTSTTSGGTANNATPAFSYDDLFPALPANSSAPMSATGGPPVVRVTSSQKTQVNKLWLFYEL